LGFVVLSLFLARAHAQDFAITGWTLDPAQGINFHYPSRPDAYFILYQGSSLTEVELPSAVEPGIMGPATFTSYIPPGSGASFFRLRAVPVMTPLDLDGDGMDDIYELSRRPQLDPLNRRDAGLDPDGDLLSNAVEYRGGTDPFVSEFATPTLTAPISPTRAASVSLTGRARPGMAIKVEGGTTIILGTVGGEGVFEVNVPLQFNRLNRLFVTGINAAGQASAPQTLDVVHDAQPPQLYFDFPTHSQVMAAANIVVAGRVGDLLSGFLGLAVTVTNISALAAGITEAGGPATVDVGIGNNGTYERRLPLVAGTNQLQVTATDVLGNQTSRLLEVSRVEPVGPRLVVESGDLQRTNVHRRLAQPIVVRLTAADGTTPLVGRVVLLEVTRSDGRLLPRDTHQLAADYTQRVDVTPAGAGQLELRTDAQGEVAAQWTLGADAGCGNNRLSVTSSEAAQAVFLCASASAAPARQINVGTGNLQQGEVGSFVAESLRAWISDGCNGVMDIPVTFTVVQGGGLLFPVAPAGSEDGAGRVELTVPSRRTGHAAVRLRLGSLAGENLVEANWPGNPGRPVTFSAYSVVRKAGQLTAFTGLVLDNTSQPIGHAACELVVSGVTNRTFSDEQGRFRFTNLVASTGGGSASSLSGLAHLHVNGFTATSLGTNLVPTNLFPSLQFTTTLVPNAENSLPTPVLLPCLNTNNAHVYDGTTDLVLTCEGVAGLEMTIAANSMRHPHGALVTPAEPALVSLNQVHHDKVPMPMPDGAAPAFAWTLQPGGAQFDPPVRVAYPNLNGLAPGSIAYFLSFNHDTERFEIVSSAQVVADGSRIVSDPGSGLTVAGWGGNCPPYEVTENVEVCQPENATPSPNDLVFADQPIVPNDNNLFGEKNLCGLTQNEMYQTAWCECDDAGDRTIPRFNLEFRVFDKWYWAGITDPADIAFVTEHENRHVEVWREVFNQLLKEVEDINGVRLASEGECTQALEEFRAFVKAELEIAEEIQRTEVDNLEEKIRCTLLLLKYSLPGNRRPVRPAETDPDLPDDFILSLREPLWKVNANGQSALVANPRSFRLRNVSAPDRFGAAGPGTPPDFLSDDLVRLTGVSTETGVNRYLATDFLQLRVGQKSVVTSVQFSDTPPRVPDSLQAIPDLPTLTALGQTTRLHVFGRFTDSSNAELSDRSQGTTYRVSNPAIASIDPQGLVTAHRAGFVLIAASNQGVTAATPLLVSLGDSLTRVAGLVQRADGTPVAGAYISVSGYAQGTTGPDGRFVLSGVPTAFGPLNVAAFIVENNVRQTGVIRQVPVNPGGETDPGVITLRPVGLRAPAIAVGFAHTLALRTDGSLWAWGPNSFGQVGNGTSVNQPRPIRVGLDLDWASVSAGTFHSAALKQDGSLWTWGANVQGQLGDGTTTLRRNPGRIGAERPWKRVATGGRHTVALAVGGTLWAWGDNPAGQLGTGTITDLRSPTQIGVDTDWQWVSAGDAHTVALKQDGSLWAWGDNAFRQVGNGSGVDQLAPLRLGVDSDWWFIAAGGFHTVALKRNGTLWAWGDNTWGQIGGGSFRNAPVPLLVSATPDWATISAGQFHTTALKLDGVRWSWGQNSEGQLGNERRGPTVVTAARVGTAIDWVETSSGGRHTVALTADQRLWTWGDNDFGQLGSSRTGNQATPVQIGVQRNWRAIAVGEGHGLGFTQDGALWAWGFNFRGQVGDGATGVRLSPVFVGTAPDWAAVAGGAEFTLATRKEGTLWSWGENLVGQLGDGTAAPRSEPGQVGAETDWIAVAAGQSHALALRSGGRLWAWGANSAGQLGDGTFAGRRRPVPVQPEVGWALVAAGARHSLGLREDGSLWTWGDNNQGQLGTGTRINLPAPTRVGSGSDWVRLASGREFSLALQADGSLWAWGDNSLGQLGDGTNTDQLIPQRIGTDTNWSFIAAGSYHAVALKQDGTLWAWGENGAGQLGDGSTTDRRTPVLVGAERDWAAAAAGADFTVALKADGTLWAWGSNHNGQLGLGAINSVEPGLGWGYP